MTWFRGQLAALVLFSVLLCPPATARDDVIPAKVGMEWLSKEQQQTLWRRVDQYAGMESFVSFCGRPSHIERGWSTQSRPASRRQPCSSSSPAFART